MNHGLDDSSFIEWEFSRDVERESFKYCSLTESAVTVPRGNFKESEERSESPCRIS